MALAEFAISAVQLALEKQLDVYRVLQDAFYITEVVGKHVQL